MTDYSYPALLVLLLAYGLRRLLVPAAVAIGISLTLKGVSDMNVNPGNYVLTAAAIPAGSTLTGLSYQSSDPGVLTVTPRADDPFKADVNTVGFGSATITCTGQNSSLVPVQGTLEVNVVVPATSIALTLEPA